MNVTEYPNPLEWNGSRIYNPTAAQCEEAGYHLVDRQAAKPDALKTMENTFISFCDQLSGTTAHQKLGFAELKVLVEALSDPVQKLTLGLTLLTINAELQRDAGLLWWDDCVWHPEIA